MIIAVIKMEKIFYNGNFPYSDTGHDALYIRNGFLIESGYLNKLKAAHPASVMMDLNRAFMLPGAVPSGAKEGEIPADMLVLSGDPFKCEDTAKIKILQIYKNGEPQLNS